MANKAYTAVMVTQQLEELHLSNDMAIENITAQWLTDCISAVFNDELKEVHTIIHNEDEKQVWNDALNCYDVEPKVPHFHSVLKFKKPKTLRSIASDLNLPEEFVENPKSKGRYAYSNMLSYLIHAKDAHKHPYQPEQVSSYGNKSYMKYYAECIKSWNIGKAKKAKERALLSVDDIRLKIFNGEIVSMSQIYLTDDYFNVYQFNPRPIDEAFEIMGAKKAFETAELIRNGKLFKQCFFITGKAGKGKTSYAKAFCAKYQEENNYKVCHTAATNMFDDYKGEEILFMDDVRGGGCNAEDWLKLLDNCNVSPASARYKNKLMAPRIVIITSTKPLYEFFYFTKGIGAARAEALDQFIRRFQSLIEVIDYDTYNVYKTKPLESAQNTYVTTDGYRNEAIYEWLHYGFELLSKGASKDESIKLLADMISDNKPACYDERRG